MPLNTALKKVLVIGSGPIVIGQAAEFDYAGTQACKALREQGLRVVLANSNPATLMTDSTMADAIYIEPLIPETIKRIIEKERPDSLLSTLGGQTGLTLSMQLAKEGFLDRYGVRLLGARPDTIDRAEDRQLFKDTMLAIGEPVIPSKVVTDAPDALAFAREIGYPVIVRPAFTLGGTGGGIADGERALREIAENGLRRSPIRQILVEKGISGWKEIEYEVIRDGVGNVITVCSMENFDPVGVHTGDSIVIAPAVTLSDKEYQMLRSSALNIISALKVEGGCNVQFALKPDSFEYAVIEVNPRVSRSSALASKATGYPIAKVAALIAVGYRLDEIPNAVTHKTAACFEPVLDYVVVKFPKWPFDKFVYAKRTLGTQMKATGEVMAIGTSFEQALMKAVRGAEISVNTLSLPAFAAESDEAVFRRVGECTDQRLFAIFQALKRGMTIGQIHGITKIDRWFLAKLAHLADIEARFAALKAGATRPASGASAAGKTANAGNAADKAASTRAAGADAAADNAGYAPALDAELYREAKDAGYPDAAIEAMLGAKIPDKMRLYPSYKMVDTCAGEFSAETPYFYATYGAENEAAAFLAKRA
jgi:carbamoyl-phosphate synthase large subunit